MLVMILDAEAQLADTHIIARDALVSGFIDKLPFAAHTLERPIIPGQAGTE